jgi:hypothetical protein
MNGYQAASQRTYQGVQQHEDQEPPTPATKAPQPDSTTCTALSGFGHKELARLAAKMKVEELSKVQVLRLILPFKPKLTFTLQCHHTVNHEYDAQGNTRWFVIAEGNLIPREWFWVTQSDIDTGGVPFALWLWEYCRLSRAVRREKYNNLFQNYYQERKELEKKREGEKQQKRKRAT